MENFVEKHWKSLSTVALIGKTKRNVEGEGERRKSCRCCSKGLSTWIYNRWGVNRRIYFNDRQRLDGQTIVITGANAGIGYETAKDLLRRGLFSLLLFSSLRSSTKESLQEVE